MATPTPPSRSFPRNAAAAIAAISLGLGFAWGLDAWLRSRPLLVQAPRDAPIWDLRDSRFPLRTAPVCTNRDTGDSWGHWLPDSAHAGAHLVHVRDAVFFWPDLGVLVRHWPTFLGAWRAGKEGVPTGPGNRGYLYFNHSFVLSGDKDYFQRELVTWQLDGASKDGGLVAGRQCFIPNADGSPAFLAVWNSDPIVADCLWWSLPADYVPGPLAAIQRPASPPGNRGQLTCSNLQLLDLVLKNPAIEADAASAVRQFFDYPGVRALAGGASGGVSLTRLNTASDAASTAYSDCENGADALLLQTAGTSEGTVLEAIGFRESVQAGVPQEFGGWPGLAMPPSLAIANPVFAWKDTQCVAATSCVAASAASLERQPEEAHAILSIRSGDLWTWLGQPHPSGGPADGESREMTYFGHVRAVESGSLKGKWLVFLRSTDAPPILPGVPVPGATSAGSAVPAVEPVAGNDRARIQRRQSMKGGQATAADMEGAWPHETWEICDVLIRGGLRDAAFAKWEETAAVHAKGWPPGLPPMPYGLKRSAVQAAWSLLTADEVYRTLSGGQAAAFVGKDGEALRECAEEIVEWKRGPDAAPLSALEESAGPADLYPVLVAWLGLKAAVSGSLSGAVAREGWQARLNELQTELSARLLQEGQCLTCGARLVRLARDLGGLSPAALDALARLPECKRPVDEPDGMLPVCAD